MIPVIIVSFFVLASFIAFIIYLIKIIFKSRKKEKAAKVLIIKTIVSGIISGDDRKTAIFSSPFCGGNYKLCYH